MTLADRKDTRKNRPSPAGRPDCRTSNKERANPVRQRSSPATATSVMFNTDILLRFIRHGCNSSRDKIANKILQPCVIRLEFV